MHHRFGEIPEYVTQRISHLSLAQAEALVDAAGVASLDVDTTRDLQALEERLRRPTQ